MGKRNRTVRDSIAPEVARDLAMDLNRDPLIVRLQATIDRQASALKKAAQVEASLRGELRALRAAPPTTPTETTQRCACGRYDDMGGHDERVDDQNRKIHTTNHCGFEACWESPLGWPGCGTCPACVNRIRSLSPKGGETP